ncbi:MAG: transglycosylase SLT domain-containing protein [Elainellaceae cyanobacterium]
MARKTQLRFTALKQQLRAVSRKNRLWLLISLGIGVGALSLGGAWVTFNRLSGDEATAPETLESGADSTSGPIDPTNVSTLATESASDRRQTLEAIAAGKVGNTDKRDRAQAKYLLASDLLDAGNAEQALPYLKGLERDYPVLAPHVLVKRATGYEDTGSVRDAMDTWKTLLKRHGNDPAAAEALYALGTADGNADQTYWKQALNDFPAHPKTVAWTQAQLAENPDQPELLLLLARHALYLPEIESILDQLVQEYSAQLQPDDWERIGFGYWEMQRYGKASEAYAKAPATALNQYRAGRGAHLDDRRAKAIAYYQALNQNFPEAEETAQGLLHLANLTELENALPYTNRVVEAFPERAAEALLLRAELMTLMNSPESAQQARQSILTQYGSSDEAAELRWSQSEQSAESGDISTAWRWAAEIVRQNPKSEQAPAAAFWIGHWAQKMGKSDVARAAFEHVLKTYPESYYAWRGATSLGWDVGDFSTARYKMPAIAVVPERSPLPAGSDELQVLYQLGQYDEAWALWQVEYDNLAEPTVAQQMTDGLIRLGVGDNLEGIFMLSSLSWRAKETAEFSLAAAQTSPAYWRGRYPVPFRSLIETWSTAHKLNPVLVTALIRQESRFETAITSSAEAQGLMQVIPPTADWVANQIGLTDYDLSDPDDNIRLGTWYLNYTHQEYGDNSLYAVASYNAGPGSVADWIGRFDTSDADQFIAQIPFPETKNYVRSVFENYWNYLRLYNPAVMNGLKALETQSSGEDNLQWLEASSAPAP